LKYSTTAFAWDFAAVEDPMKILVLGIRDYPYLSTYRLGYRREAVERSMSKPHSIRGELQYRESEASR
jgi:hypothetical protein